MLVSPVVCLPKCLPSRVPSLAVMGGAVNRASTGTAPCSVTGGPAPSSATVAGPGLSLPPEPAQRYLAVAWYCIDITKYSPAAPVIRSSTCAYLGRFPFDIITSQTQSLWPNAPCPTPLPLGPFSNCHCPFSLQPLLHIKITFSPTTSHSTPRSRVSDKLPPPPPQTG